MAPPAHSAGRGRSAPTTRANAHGRVALRGALIDPDRPTRPAGLSRADGKRENPECTEKQPPRGAPGWQAPVHRTWGPCRHMQGEMGDLGHFRFLGPVVSQGCFYIWKHTALAISTAHRPTDRALRVCFGRLTHPAVPPALCRHAEEA